MSGTPGGGGEILLAEGTLLVSTGSGDVPGEPGSGLGLFVADTRLISRWILRVSGGLTVAAVHPTPGGRRLALLPPGRRNRPDPLLVDRDQRVDRDGLHESITLTTTSDQPLEVTVVLTVDTDFADQFMLRTDGRRFDRSAARQEHAVRPDGLRFTYRHERDGRTFTATGLVTADPPPAVTSTPAGHDLTWTLTLAPRTSTTLTVQAGPREAPSAPSSRVTTPYEGQPSRPGAVDELDAVARQCGADLDALMIPSPAREGEWVPAAGAPWFLTLFGRDSLLTVALAGADRPELAIPVLRALAATQGTVDDPRSREQPGRIVHETRRSELAVLGLVPYGRYYGSVDVTALFLVLLGRCAIGPEAVPGGTELARELRESALAGVGWLRGPGGLDEHGFVRYEADPGGLINQGWKDSEDSTVFADGRVAAGPIALCEVQGYTWDALTHTALLARAVWDEPGLADELDAVAAGLRARFLDRFWLADRQFPALALDGEGRPVDAVGSNAGHLLWSGLLPGPAAAAVAGRLLDPSSFSGWGIRTLAAGQRPYSPLSYHNGSVWPHDTMLIALGLLRAGFPEAARRLATGIAGCAARLGNSLPELVGGFSTAEFPEPVGYAFAGRPQAWSAAAGLAAVRILRG